MAPARRGDAPLKEVGRQAAGGRGGAAGGRQGRLRRRRRSRYGARYGARGPVALHFVPRGQRLRCVGCMQAESQVERLARGHVGEDAMERCVARIAAQCVRLPSEAIRGDQRRSEAIRGGQRRSEAIRGDQRRSEAIRGDQRPSVTIRGDQRRSEAIRGDECRSAVISSDECRSASIIGTQRHSPAPHAVETTARDDARHPTDARVIGCVRCPGWPRSQ